MQTVIDPTRRAQAKIGCVIGFAAIASVTNLLADTQSTMPDFSLEPKVLLENRLQQTAAEVQVIENEKDALGKIKDMIAATRKALSEAKLPPPWKRIS